MISDDEEIKLDRSISLREQYYIKHVNIIEDFVEKSYPEPAPNPTRSNLLFYLGEYHFPKFLNIIRRESRSYAFSTPFCQLVNCVSEMATL